jgi:hypothetical protein
MEATTTRVISLLRSMPGDIFSQKKVIYLASKFLIRGSSESIAPARDHQPQRSEEKDNAAQSHTSLYFVPGPC